MATRYITRSMLLTIKQTLTSVAVSRHSLRHRPLIAAASAFNFARDEGNVFSARSFATSQTTSSLNDPDPNWNNRPPKETIYLDGCDFEHWVVIMKQPEGDPSRDEIIDSYIKTFAMVVGSEEEARMKIYSVSTRHYFAFGALVSEELAFKLKELPRVQWVLPDSYLDVKNKDYGGEPFINGQAVPYDPKYHEWLTVTYRGSENQELGMGEGAEFGCEEERNENGVFGEEDPEIRREKKIFQWNFIYSKIKNMFSLLIFRERPKN